MKEIHTIDSFQKKKEINQYRAEFSESKTCVHFLGKPLPGLDYACRRSSRGIACRGFDWKRQEFKFARGGQYSLSAKGRASSHGEPVAQ